MAGGAPAGADAQRLILRGGGSAALGYAIRFGARLLFLFVAARLYGVALFGAYSLAIAAVELAVAVGVLGMKRLLFKLFEERPGERLPAHVLLDTAVPVAGVSLALAAATMAVVAALPETVLAPNTAAALLLAAPMIAGQALLDLFLAATRWKHRMRYEVAARSIVEPYAATAALLVAHAAGAGASGLVISYWVGTLAALGYAAAGARRCFGGFALRRYRPQRSGAILRIGAAAAATDLSSALFARVDLYLVGMLMGESAAGLYNMARQVRTPIRQVRQAFDTLLTPVLARTLAAEGPAGTAPAIATAARLILAIQLPMLLGLAVVGLPLLRWLGPEFAGAYVALLLLAAAETIQGAFSLGDLVLLYLRARLAAAVTASMLVITLVAAPPLIARFGIEGAAMAVLVAIAAGALLRRMLLRLRFQLATPLLHSLGPLAAAAVGAAAALVAIDRIGPDSGAMLHVAALLAVLVVYGAALVAWLRATGGSLALAGFRTQ